MNKNKEQNFFPFEKTKSLMVYLQSLLGGIFLSFESFHWSFTTCSML